MLWLNVNGLAELPCYLVANLVALLVIHCLLYAPDYGDMTCLFTMAAASQDMRKVLSPC